jgi:hypothetical protein
MAQFNYSARAGEYDGAGASLSPLTAQIGAFSFFRIEGHLGREASAAVSEIEATIKTSNLPFLVRSVLLGGDRPKIVVKPPIRYTDLNRLHYILRQDLSQQLDDVVTHNTTFRTEVNAAIDRKDVVDAPVTGGFPSIKAFADAKQTGISDAAGKAKAKLNVGYAEYRKAATWQGDVKQTVTHAAELKYYLGGVARTEFATPVDSLVSNNHVLWVDWLDRVIQDKDDKEDDKLLFANFIQQHPSAEHFGGVGRGGTFVLVYNSAGIVIGDVALPYRWAETAEPPPAEPPLPRPDVKPPIVIDKGVRIVPALDNVIASRIDVRLADFKTTAVDPIRDQGINFQKNYVQALKDSVAVTGKFSPTTSVPLPGVKDSTLDTKVRETQDMVFKVDEIQKQLIDPTLDATKRTDLENQLTAARKDLATSVTDTAKYVSTTPTLDARTDSAVAITVISDAMSKLSHDQATSVATTVKTDLAGAVAAKPEVKTMIGGMLKVRGFTN